jgi:creatinine amidohydrolase
MASRDGVRAKRPPARGRRQRLRSNWLHELRWPEVAAYLRRSDLILIPIGATEQHGTHLPLAVDTGWAIEASAIAARITDVLVAPPLHYGWSPHHMGYPGTVTLRAETLLAVATDIASSLVEHGFRRIIFVNGNRIANLPPLEIAIVEIKNRTGAFAGIADAGLIAKGEVSRLCRAPDGGLDHAGEAETSFALHWMPAGVEMPKAAVRKPPRQWKTRFDYTVELDPKRAGNAVSFAVSPEEHRAATSPDGTVNDPSLGNAVQGRKIIEAIGRNLASFIEEVRAAPIGVVRKPRPL